MNRQMEEWRRDSEKEIPAVIQEYVGLAVDAVKNMFNLDLDLSSDTLSLVDHYLKSVGEVEENVELLVAATVGSYFGEMVRLSQGGSWFLPETSDPLNWEFRLSSCPFSFFPVAIALEVIRGGAVEEVDASFSTAPARYSMLLDAFDHAPAMTQEDYYSLAGRLDAIELAIDLLAEVERLQAQEEQRAPRVFGDLSTVDVDCSPFSGTGTDEDRDA